jgi:hypothetical protein
MHWGLILPMVASVIACSNGSQKPQPVIGPGVQHNLGDLAAMMDQLHLLMFEGPFTAKQSTEVSNMMLRVSIMMKEMSGPDRERLAAKHEQELKEMRRRVEEIRAQVKSQS